jgi:hypothetical protein
MLSHLARAVDRNSSGIYVTDDMLNNPWDRLPAYWSQLVDAVAEINADYNRNGGVDTADYVFWRKSVGQSGIGLDADGNGDRVVDNDDLLHWRRRFAQTHNAAVAGQSIPILAPEPTAVTVCALLFGPLAAAHRSIRPTP